MNKSLLSAIAVLLAGSGIAAMASDTCATCGVEKKISDSKCGGTDKCYMKIKEPVLRDVTVPVIEPVKKECFVPTTQKVVKKVPIKTYRIIEEWVDSPVREEYYETIKIREKKHVAPRDERFAYVLKDGEVSKNLKCTEIVVKEEDVCKPVRINDQLVRYDKCGHVEKLPMQREGSVSQHHCKYTREKAVCEVKLPGKVKNPQFVAMNAKRNGYFTTEYKVKKFRVVPGKVLRQRRISETVMMDMVENVPDKRPVTREVKEWTKNTTEKRLVNVKKRVEVDCVTGLPVAAPDKKTAAKTAQAPVKPATPAASAAPAVTPATAPAPEAAPAIAPAPAVEPATAPAPAATETPEPVSEAKS